MRRQKKKKWQNTIKERWNQNKKEAFLFKDRTEKNERRRNERRETKNPFCLFFLNISVRTLDTFLNSLPIYDFQEFASKLKLLIYSNRMRFPCVDKPPTP